MMSKGKQKSIGLISSSPELPTSSSCHEIANQHTNAAGAESSLGSHTPVSNISVLAGQFYTRDGLYRHLLLLGPEALSHMLLSQVNDDQLRPKPATPKTPKTVPKQPVEQNPQIHCVYCHKTFSKQHKWGCKVEHFGIPKATDKSEYKVYWTCCGRGASFVKPDSDCGAVDEDLYCYRGKHWEKEIRSKDKVAGWWGEWAENGRSCAKRGCEEGVGKIVGTGRLVERMRMGK